MIEGVSFGVLAIEKGTRDMEMTGRFLAVVAKHDPKATSKLAATMKVEAANDASHDDADWQQLLADDPAYIEWIERLAEEEDYRHARW
jgi:hypothetical protein